MISIQTSVPEMSLFQFSFSQRSGDVGEKEVEKKLTSIRLPHEDSYLRAYHCGV